VSRVRLITGNVDGGNVTVRPSKEPFKASYKGICKSCHKPYGPGAMIRSQGKGKGAMHVACAEWHFKGRNRPQTKDGGYDVAPATPTRSERNLVYSTNRRIERSAQFGNSSPEN
jgi:hypothetical protein